MGNAKRKERKKAGEKFVHPPKVKNSEYGAKHSDPLDWFDPLIVRETKASVDFSRQILKNYGLWQERNKWY